METSNKSHFVGFNKYTIITGLGVKQINGASYAGGLMAVQSMKPGSMLAAGFLMNRLVDKCDKIDAKERDEAVRRITAEYGEILKVAAIKKKVLAFLPFPRAGLPWTVELLGTIHETLRLVLLDSGVTVMPYLEVRIEDYESDGIHINESSQALQFVHYLNIFISEKLGDLVAKTSRKRPIGGTIDSPAKRSLPTEDRSDLGDISVMNQPTPIEVEVVVAQPGTSNVTSQDLFFDLSRPPPPRSTGAAHVRAPETLTDVRDRLVALEREGVSVQNAIAELTRENMLNAELTDSALNSTNAHVVIIDNLLKLTDTAGSDAKVVVAELCSLLDLDENSVKAAFFLKLGKAPERTRHFKIKAIFVDADAAIAFRSGASRARRETSVEPWVTSYVSNDPTKSTRVRIEILKQIGTHLGGHPSMAGTNCYVTRYDARPVLVHKRGDKIIRRMGYVEAIDKFGYMLTPEHLKTARKIAGKQFEGRFFKVFGV